jgi:hypothetical protein
MLAAMLAGCTTSSVDYSAALSEQDPKWQSPQCERIRAEALDYETRAKKNMGWGTGLLLGAYGIGLVAAIKDHERKQRTLFAREIHMQCSSQPLPKELQIDASSQESASKRTKYP